MRKIELAQYFEHRGSVITNFIAQHNCSPNKLLDTNQIFGVLKSNKYNNLHKILRGCRNSYKTPQISKLLTDFNKKQISKRSKVNYKIFYCVSAV